MTENSGQLLSLRSVAVIGGGRMGAGIAHAFLMSGCTVTVIEPGEAEREAARAGVARSVAKSDASSGEPEPPGVVMARLSLVGDVLRLSSGVDLVVEAVPEIFDLKLQLLREVESVVDSDAIIASNTSSLAISDLAHALSDQTRFLGMHFFNPVPVSRLVELVAGDRTSELTVQRAQAIVESLGKVSIVIRDSPGFATSRLGLALGLEAMRMLEDAVGSAADIDQAMVLGYRHPIGPLRLTDMVGLDVRLAVAEHLQSTLGGRFEPPEILRAKVAAGELGMKSGKGFYVWA